MGFGTARWISSEYGAQAWEGSGERRLVRGLR